MAGIAVETEDQAETGAGVEMTAEEGEAIVAEEVTTEVPVTAEEVTEAGVVMTEVAVAAMIEGMAVSQTSIRPSGYVEWIVTEMAS